MSSSVLTHRKGRPAREELPTPKSICINLTHWHGGCLYGILFKPLPHITPGSGSFYKDTDYFRTTAAKDHKKDFYTSLTSACQQHCRRLCGFAR